MPAPAVTTVVITDTNVLINFLHIGQLALLGELPAYRFQLPTEVLQELTGPEQRAAVDNAIAAGQLDLLVIDALDALALFGDYRRDFEGAFFTSLSSDDALRAARRPGLLLPAREDR